MPLFFRVFALLLAASAHNAQAQIPDAFRPVVVEAAPGAERRFNLSPAIERARAEKKLLFIYLGARDCPFCTQYERFLLRNQEALIPLYARHVVVDIRTWLSGPQPIFEVGGRKYNFGEFQALVGDGGRKKPAYPYFWILTPDLRAKEIPRGTALFRDLQTHTRFLGT